MTNNPSSNIPTIILDDEQLASFNNGLGCFVTDKEGVVQGFINKDSFDKNLVNQEFFERAHDARASLHLMECLMANSDDFLDLNPVARAGLGVFLQDQQEKLLIDK